MRLTTRLPATVYLSHPCVAGPGGAARSRCRNLKLRAGHCRLVRRAPRNLSARAGLKILSLVQPSWYLREDLRFNPGMRTLLLGIDSGTQSTKVLVVDARDGKVIASAAQEYELIPNLPPGAKEQHPHTWRDATAGAIRRALLQAKAVAAEVKAIGVSGQQHGFVPLDKAGEVIRPAKLWCDTSTEIGRAHV